MIQEFLRELTAHYSSHHLAPSLILSQVNVKGEQKFYAAVHTFPNGFNSRYIVCKYSDVDYEGCVAGIVATWRRVVADATILTEETS